MKKLIFICIIICMFLAIPYNGVANKISKNTTEINDVELNKSKKINEFIIKETENVIKEIEKIYTFEEYNVPFNDFKSYMPYEINGKSIFSKSSKQYELQQYAHTTETGLREINGHFCVAIGTGYTELQIGDYAKAVLENGTVIPIIISDIKADIHTDKSNKITIHDNSAIEFIVDTKLLDKTVKKMGDISYLTDSYKSKVVKYKIYNRNYFDEHSEDINEKD